MELTLPQSLFYAHVMGIIDGHVVRRILSIKKVYMFDIYIYV